MLKNRKLSAAAAVRLEQIAVNSGVSDPVIQFILVSKQNEARKQYIAAAYPRNKFFWWQLVRYGNLRICTLPTIGPRSRCDVDLVGNEFVLKSQSGSILLP